MVKISTVCSLILLYSSILFSQWQPVNTFNKSIWLNSVFFTDDDHGWIAGNAGTILKFNSLSFNWNNIPETTKEDLYSISFFDTLYGIAAGANGIQLRSTNGGETWSVKSLGTTESLNQIHIINNTTGWIAGGNGLLLKTTDKGESWVKVFIPTTKSLTSVHFTSLKKGFIGTDSTSLFITTDGGNTWSETIFDSFFYPNSIFSISFPDSLYGYIGGGYPNMTIFSKRTTDGGKTWIEGPQTRGAIRSLSFKDRTNGIITGGDNTWNRFLDVVSDSTDITTIFHSEDYDIMSSFITPSGRGWAVGGGGAVFYAQNFQKDWGQVLIGGTDQPYILSLSKEKYFFLVSNRSNFRTGAAVYQKGFHENRIWKDVSRYMDNDNAGDIANSFCMIDSMNGYCMWDGSILRTINGGYTWNYLTTPGSGGMFFLDQSTGWHFNDIIKKTTDSALTWNIKYNSSFKISDLIFLDNNTGYACGADSSLNGKVIKSTDGGETWFPLTIPAAGYLTSVAFANPDTGIIVGWGNTILKTTNGGLSWSYSASAGKIAVTERYSVKRIPAKNDKRYILSFNGSLYKETKVADAGNYLDADFKNNNIFIASDSGYVLRSADFGKTWQQDIVGESVLQVIFDGKEFAAARTGKNIFVFKNDSSFPVYAGNSNAVKPEFQLAQNYPNPFNPTTRIRYQISQPGSVKIKIFDSIGREIAMLENSFKPAGSYEINFNSSDYRLASGIYFYSIQSGNNILTRKMVLLK